MRSGIIAMSALSLFFSACGGSFVSSARKSLYVTSETIRKVDDIAARKYSAQASMALAESTTAEQYRSRMEAYDELEISLRAVHTALLAADAGLDIYEETGSKADWKASVACAVATLDDLFERMDLIYGRAPEGLHDAIEMLRVYGGECEQGQEN